MTTLKLPAILIVVVLSVISLLGACSTTTKPATNTPAAESVGESREQNPAPENQAPESNSWKLTDSQLVIHVGKAGQLARLGHNHLVSSARLAGGGAFTSDGSLIGRVALDVADLEVDSPALRAAYRARENGNSPWAKVYASTPSEQNMADTRANMLGPRVLDALNYPRITVTLNATAAHAEIETATAGTLNAQLGLSIRNTTADLPAILHWQRQTPDRIVWQSEFQITHAALGMTPFSALGGALSVAEILNIEVTGNLERSGNVQKPATSVIQEEKEGLTGGKPHDA